MNGDAAEKPLADLGKLLDAFDANGSPECLHAVTRAQDLMPGLNDAIRLLQQIGATREALRFAAILRHSGKVHQDVPDAPARTIEQALTAMGDALAGAAADGAKGRKAREKAQAIYPYLMSLYQETEQIARLRVSAVLGSMIRGAMTPDEVYQATRLARSAEPALWDKVHFHDERN